ncbi:hypothetical protein CN354_21090 [Bacillus cereus]|nr:hypothetical protein CN354_21090 [Bacillus cereus]
MVLTWYGAKKGFDRFYAWLDALSHLKKVCFNPYFHLSRYFRTVTLPPQNSAKAKKLAGR